MALKHADVPVVVAPAGLTLGGGCEIALHADARAGRGRNLHRPGRSRRRPDPGRRRHERDAGARDGRRCRPAPIRCRHVQRVFETIGFAKVSTSAPDARRLGYLRDGDAITMNRERLLADAKALRAAARRDGLSRRRGRARRFRVGGESMLRHAEARRPPRLARRPHQRSRRASIGRKLAWILAGGDLPHRTTRQRAAAARPRARSVPEPVRRAEDARAHRSTR